MLRGLVAGLIVGIIIGAAGLVAAGTGKKLWLERGQEFQVGYLSGFFDAALMGRNLEPGGFFDQRYPMWPGVKLMSWYHEALAVAKEDESEGYTMAQVLGAVAGRFHKKHGKPPTAFDRVAKQWRAILADGDSKKVEGKKRAAPTEEWKKKWAEETRRQADLQEKLSTCKPSREKWKGCRKEIKKRYSKGEIEPKPAPEG